MSLRLEEVQRSYDEYLKQSNNRCDFCELHTQQLIREEKYFVIIKNLFPYASWDSQSVAKHWMIIPKRHIVSLHDLTEIEKIEFVDLLSQYEKDGASIYSRAPKNTSRTITHVHTHLLYLQHS